MLRVNLHDLVIVTVCYHFFSTKSNLNPNLTSNLTNVIFVAAALQMQALQYCFVFALGNRYPKG